MDKEKFKIASSAAEAAAKRPDPSKLISMLTTQLYLRDVLLLILTANNEYDGKIVTKMIEGIKLDSGEWDHIFSEAAKIKMPEPHTKALSAIHAALSRNSAAI
jgi:hypothetical protein